MKRADTLRAIERDGISLLREIRRRCYDDLPLDLWSAIENMLTRHAAALKAKKRKESKDG